MNRPIIISSAIVGLGVAAVVIVCEPSWLSDENEFLKGFVNHEFLNVLGVILAITLASLAQLHLGINTLEERAGRAFLQGARREIRSSARWLIAGFLGGLFLVWLKPLLGSGEVLSNARIEATVNTIALYLLVFYALILIDITGSIFDVEPDLGPNKNRQHEDR